MARPAAGLMPNNDNIAEPTMRFPHRVKKQLIDLDTPKAANTLEIPGVEKIADSSRTSRPQSTDSTRANRKTPWTSRNITERSTSPTSRTKQEKSKKLSRKELGQLVKYQGIQCNFRELWHFGSKGPFALLARDGKGIQQETPTKAINDEHGLIR